MVDAIQAECIRLSRLGLAMHWLGRRSKVPLSCSWASFPCFSPSDLVRQYRTGYNAGIHTGKVRGARVSVVVVDCDSERAVEWARKNLPPTPICARTRKGEHWYFAAPDGGSTRAKVRIESERLDLDVRGDGGQVVCPPSIHPEGFVYERMGAWEAEDFDRLPLYHDEWFPRAAPSAQPARPTLPSCRADSGEAARRAAGLLRAMVRRGEVYERGNGQGTKTFMAARILLNDFGLSESQTFDLLAQWYNSACPQPYSADELRRKVTEAATKGRSVATRYMGVNRG